MAGTLTWDDFSGGHAGSAGLVKAKPGTFRGRNMTITEEGNLTVRPGVDDLGLTGVPVGTITTVGFNGTPGADVWVIIGSAVYARNGSALTAFTGALAVTPTAPVAWIESAPGITHITVPGDKCYKLDHVALTVTAIDGSPGGESIAVYGDRLYVGGSAAFPQRVWYSDPAAFTTWPAASFYDVGIKGGVVALLAQRDTLVIGLASGEWWSQRGFTPTNAILRRVTGGGVHPWDFNRSAAAILGSDDIVFMPLSGDFPAFYNGAAQAREFRNIHTSPTGTARYVLPGSVSVIRGFRPEEAVVVLGGGAVVYRWGAWVRHEFVHGAADGLWVSDGQGTIYSVKNVGGAAAKFYRWRIDLERPGFVSDAPANPGDDSTALLEGDVEFPEVWAPNGNERRVRQVVVDFTKWDTGSASTNHIGLTLVVMSRFAVDGEGTVVTPQAWDEAGTSASTTGKRDRAVFNVGDQGYAAGFRVKLENLRGITIRAVTVVYDEQPERPRY